MQSSQINIHVLILLTIPADLCTDVNLPRRFHTSRYVRIISFSVRRWVYQLIGNVHIWSSWLNLIGKL